MGCGASSAPKDKAAPPAKADELPRLSDSAPQEIKPAHGALDSQATALEKLKAVFDGIDAESNTSIRKVELSVALKKDASLPALVEAAGFNAQFYVLEQLDTNQDGRVTWDEFKASLTDAATADGNVDEAAPVKTADDAHAEKLVEVTPVVDAAAPSADAKAAAIEAAVGETPVSSAEKPAEAAVSDTACQELPASFGEWLVDVVPSTCAVEEVAVASAEKLIEVQAPESAVEEVPLASAEKPAEVAAPETVIAEVATTSAENPAEVVEPENATS